MRSDPLRVAALIPTHDHGPTIRHAIESALDQTHPVAEVLIIGDGAPPITAQIAQELAATDNRIRFFGFEKGPRHGEIHRHHVLTNETHVDLVCYLADDDVWMPDHVETMVDLLQKAETAYGLCVSIQPDGSIRRFVHNMHLPAYQELVLNGGNQVPLSGFAHRMTTYRELPHGWRTTPTSTATDIHMYSQFIKHGATARSSFLPTGVTLPSPPRLHMTIQERVAELGAYAVRRRDPEFRAELHTSMLEIGQRHSAQAQVRLWKTAGAIKREENLRAVITLLQSQVRRLEKLNRSGTVALQTLREAVARRLRPGRSSSHQLHCKHKGKPA
jgi:GalNAc5-diNAcBac-PP-undecaprenol beta-1,3-glucosyltransferase